VQTPHPLPGVPFALRRLRGFNWGREVRQVPVLVSDRGRWHSLPCVSFWADFSQVSFYGDPARPAAIEISMPAPLAESWDQKRELLEYMYDIIPALVVDNRFDRLNLEGDSFAAGDLWFTLTSPENPNTPGRWTLLLMHEPSVSPARASVSELQSISEPIAEAVIDPSKPRSWQRGSWSAAELNWLRDTSVPPPTSGAPVEAEIPAATWNSIGGERVFARSYVRQAGAYSRTASDWLKEIASAGP
jgi:hypothetical protein